MTPKILAFAGSLRVESYNKKLVKVAMEGARAAGAEVTYIDLKSYPLPVFDQDLEKSEGLPANARTLKDLFIAHHGLLISCPEYNSSISGALKNTLDWISRQDGNESGQVPYAGKVVGLLSASPGSLGAIRSLETARGILMQLGCMVLPKRLAVPHASKAFAEDGSLIDQNMSELAKGVGAELARVILKLQA